MTKQPKVFPLSIVTTLFERFGYYVMALLLVLYIKSVFNFSDHMAFLIYGVLTALVFLTPALGGYLADNIIGIRRAMVIGLFLEGLGLTIIAIPNKTTLLLGLSLIILGVGLFKTGPTNLLGRAYEENDPRIDGGFTWYYMAINIGSLLSPLIGGIMQRYFGWSFAFLSAAAVLYLNLICYFILRHQAEGVESKAGIKKLSKKTWSSISIGIILAIVISTFLLSYPTIAHMFLFVASIMLFIYFAYEVSRSPKKERLEIIACLLLIVIGMIFFIMYFQQFMSITLFIKRSIRHHILGYNVPTTFFLTLNSFWIIILSPIMVWLYNHFGKRGKDLSITSKFPLGIFITSLCFMSLKLGTFFPDAAGQISSLWLVLGIFLYSIGELLVSALGVAMVTHIAPKRMYGVMMGSWFLISNSLGAAIASSTANLSAIPKTLHDPFLILNIYGRTFFEIGIAGIIAAILTFIAAPYIKRMANIK
jgi:POT family proton-dependent oligopeptide transporter